ncbi:MAG: lipid-A-disaccharide synthase [Flavicella sp.]
MRYYIIAGEASGDLHASNLMRSLKEVDTQATFRFWGGDLMLAQGGVMVKHYKSLAFMGLLEVLKNIRTIFSNLSFCKSDVLAYKPDALILVDYPGFNMRIAEFAKKNGIQVHYYISPKIWAWKENRIYKIKRFVDHMYVIFPFEKPFYEDKHKYAVHFVGNPLIDAIEQTNTLSSAIFRANNNLSDAPIIALLPGSRKQEITKMLGVMLSMVKRYQDYQFVIAGAPTHDFSFYQQFIKAENVAFVTNQTYDLLANAHAALVTSGTATLETALFKVPEVVCYKTSWLTYQVGKRLVDLKYISLVNLVLDREVVKELIQDDLEPESLAYEMDKILDVSYRRQLSEDYHELINVLGGKGASDKTAQIVYKNALQLKEE